MEFLDGEVLSIPYRMLFIGPRNLTDTNIFSACNSSNTPSFTTTLGDLTIPDSDRTWHVWYSNGSTCDNRVVPFVLLWTQNPQRGNYLYTVFCVAGSSSLEALADYCAKKTCWMSAQKVVDWNGVWSGQSRALSMAQGQKIHVAGRLTSTLAWKAGQSGIIFVCFVSQDENSAKWVTYSNKPFAGVTHSGCFYTIHEAAISCMATPSSIPLRGVTYDRQHVWQPATEYRPTPLLASRLFSRMTETVSCDEIDKKLSPTTIIHYSL